MKLEFYLFENTKERVTIKNEGNHSDAHKETETIS